MRGSLGPPEDIRNHSRPLRFIYMSSLTRFQPFRRNPVVRCVEVARVARAATDVVSPTHTVYKYYSPAGKVAEMIPRVAVGACSGQYRGVSHPAMYN